MSGMLNKPQDVMLENDFLPALKMMKEVTYEQQDMNHPEDIYHR